MGNKFVNEVWFLSLLRSDNVGRCNKVLQREVFRPGEVLNLLIFNGVEFVTTGSDSFSGLFSAVDSSWVGVI